MSVKRSAFTLVELLVVVVIIAILMLVALPAFQGADRGSRLRTAAFQLSSTINLARQTAITQRKLVAVVFPNTNDAIYVGQPREAEKGLRAYAPFAWSPGQPIPQGMYLGEWRMLPPGIVIHPQYDAPPGVGVNIFSNNALITNSFPFPKVGGVVGRMAYVAFRPDGAMDRVGSAKHSIFLAEGIVAADLAAGKVPLPTIRSNTPTIALALQPLTGQVITREFLPRP